MLEEQSEIVEDGFVVRVELCEHFEVLDALIIVLGTAVQFTDLTNGVEVVYVDREAFLEML